jgi:predicted HNH restriction endonuclease
MKTPTFKDLNLFLLKKRGWENKPKANGKALFGLAVRLGDITDSIAIRYKTVEIDKNGQMFVVHYENFRNVSKAKDLQSRGIEPSKDIQKINISDDDPLKEDCVYIDNSYTSPDPSRLSDKTVDTTGVIVRFVNEERAIRRKMPRISPAVKQPEYLPEYKDFEKAHNALTISETNIAVEKILDEIETICKGTDLQLKNNWRYITERNITETWLKQKEIDDDKIEPTEQDVEAINKKIGTIRTSAEAEEKLRSLSKEITSKPVEERIRIAKSLARNSTFARLVKKRVNHICEICNATPFAQRNEALLYAEAHHIFELAKTRVENPDYMICVCPTCHRVLHYGSDEALQKRINLKID